MAAGLAGGIAAYRVHIFVDFWNFELAMQTVEERFRADFKALGPCLTNAACKVVGDSALGEYAGMSVYLSSDEGNPKEAPLRRWAKTILDRFPGVNVSLVPRKKRITGPKCPTCHEIVGKCPECGADMRGTEEKGVDVRIATDMIMLAWAQSYDIAVLVSSDSDLIPAAESLQTRGLKVVHGAIGPKGAHLSQKCWGSIDLPNLRGSFRLNFPARRRP